MIRPNQDTHVHQYSPTKHSRDETQHPNSAPPCAVREEVLRGSRGRVAEYLDLDISQRGMEGDRHPCHRLRALQSELHWLGGGLTKLNAKLAEKKGVSRT